MRRGTPWEARCMRTWNMDLQLIIHIPNRAIFQNESSSFFFPTTYPSGLSKDNPQPLEWLCYKTFGIQSLPASLALYPLIPPCTLLYTPNYNEAVVLHAFRTLHMLFSLPEKPFCILFSRQTRIHPLNMDSNTISLNLPR